jgi:hypothetical protein
MWAFSLQQKQQSGCQVPTAPKHARQHPRCDHIMKIRNEDVRALLMFVVAVREVELVYNVSKGRNDRRFHYSCGGSIC